MSEERCETCRFWKCREGDEAEIAGNKSGNCRRYPPQNVAAFYQLQYRVNAELPEEDPEALTIDPDEARFPHSWGSQWCGEYRHIDA